MNTVQWFDDGSGIVYDAAGNIVGSIDTGKNFVPYSGQSASAGTLQGFFQDASSRLLDKVFGSRQVVVASPALASTPTMTSSSTMIGLAVLGIGVAVLAAVAFSGGK